MAAKRAPGAGRKPRGEFQGKSAVLTTRITSETRALLERAAAKGKNRSLSQVAEKAIDGYLREYLRKPKHTPERSIHIRALGEAVMLVAQYIERATGERWIDDAFTGEAVRQGCGTLIAHFAPRGMPVTPTLIKEAATRLAQDIARATGVRETGAAIPDAVSVGVTEAGKLIAFIESWNFRTRKEVQEVTRAIPDSYFPEEWYTRADILRDLGSGWKRAQERGKPR
jgi:hypothetical protein